MSLERFAGQVALVTGGHGGIGSATAERLTAEGATVVRADLAPVLAAKPDAGAHDPRPERERATVVPLDVTDPASCAAAVAETLDSYGRLDVLVNAAGVGSFAATTTLGLDEWNRVLAVNLTGTFLMCQAAIPALIETRGSIVNVASISGIRGVPYNAAYCASKGGVVLLTRSLAIELGRQGVRVNAVCPAAVDTPFLGGFDFPPGIDLSLFARGTPVIEGLISPAQVAAAVAYLASADAAMVTGVPFLLDGGSAA